MLTYIATDPAQAIFPNRSLGGFSVTLPESDAAYIGKAVIVFHNGRTVGVDVQKDPLNAPESTASDNAGRTACSGNL